MRTYGKLTIMIIIKVTTKLEMSAIEPNVVRE